MRAECSFQSTSAPLPDSTAWRLTIAKTLRSFFEGLAGAPADARNFVDLVFEDAFPATARDPNGALSEWEKQFGLTPSSSALEVTRRLALAAEWAATGGQSPSYLQGFCRRPASMSTCTSGGVGPEPVRRS